MFKYVKGDLFKGIKGKKNVLIVHVVNDKGAFGSGFVVPLGDNFPWCEEAYHRWHEGKVSMNLYNTWKSTPDGIQGGKPKFELGQTLFVEDNQKMLEPWVAHCCAQTLGGKRPLFYNKLADCMEQVALVCQELKLNIHAPKFGSGLAGGNWDFIENLIEDIWGHLSVTIYEL